MTSMSRANSVFLFLVFFLPSCTLRHSHLTITSEDSSVVKENPGNFQLHRDWEIPSVKLPHRGRKATNHSLITAFLCTRILCLQVMFYCAIYELWRSSLAFSSVRSDQGLRWSHTTFTVSNESEADYEGADENVWIRRLSWVLAVRICDKDPFLLRWHVFVKECSFRTLAIPVIRVLFLLFIFIYFSSISFHKMLGIYLSL